MFVLFFFFFFKQKTSYELRISDWSSDVCSSDLLGARGVSGDRSRTDPARERATARDADPDRRGRRKRGRRTAAETERLDPARSRSAALGQLRKVQPPDQRNIGHQPAHGEQASRTDFPKARRRNARRGGGTRRADHIGIESVLKRLRRRAGRPERLRPLDVPLEPRLDQPILKNSSEDRKSTRLNSSH